MPTFAANLSLLFTELPFEERFAAAAAAGFETVEILFPYDVAAKEIQRALIANGQTLVLINAPPPNYTGGTPGYGAVPGGEPRFQNDIKRVLRFAEVLKPEFIHVMSGYCDGADAFDTFVANLQWAADAAPHQMFTIEPLNPGDQPGYFLNNFDLAGDILDKVARANVGLQYDSYHAQVIHGDALAVWEKHKSRVVHAQIGDAPGRTEPGKGQVDFDALFAAMDNSHYAGHVSAEYKPTTARTEDSLNWLQEAR